MIDPVLVLFSGVFVLVVLREMTPRRLEVVQTDRALQLQPNSRRIRLDLGTVLLGIAAGIAVVLSPSADRPFGAFFVGLMVVRAAWQLGGSWWRFPIRIDRVLNQVQSGRQTIGPANNVIQVEFTGRRRSPVALVLPAERGQWRWPVPGVPASQAGELGRVIADYLEVPFRNMSDR
jgi:hypothetical protein